MYTSDFKLFGLNLSLNIDVLWTVIKAKENIIF